MSTEPRHATTIGGTALAPLIMGTLAFFLVVGPRALRPTNIAWLGSGDPATHFLGWHFFRHSDWSFPIGLNPNYGLEISNAIVFSDSNPLLAFFFKLLSPALPETFQYFGLWLLACFVLQAWFGWKLIGLISTSFLIRLLGAGLLLFAPPMIWRLHGHFSLCGHFLIVAALYFVLHPKLEKRLIVWGALLSASALVHAYFLAMVLLFWLVDLTGRRINGQQTSRQTLTEFASTILLIGFVCWQAGYLSVGKGAAAGGYGLYRMNLLSILDSSGWSYLLKDIPEARGDYEGFNYLGLGVVTLTIIAIPNLASRTLGLRESIGRMPLLCCALIGLTLFALSNKIGIGIFEFEYPLPDTLLRIANIFQSSGRMFWPVFYVLVFSIIAIVVRAYYKRTAIVLLAFALAIQVVDTSAAWDKIRTKLMVEPISTWNTPLKDPFWSEAGQRYSKVRAIPPGSYTPHWQTLAAYAGRYRLATDAVYLARVNKAALQSAQAKAITALRTGEYQQNALYILDDVSARQAMPNLKSDSELLARIDGLNVLAPRWKKCANCRRVDSELKVSDLFPAVKVGQRLDFKEAGNGIEFLGGGWSAPGAHGTRSDGTMATIGLRVSDATANTVEIEGHPLVSGSHPRQNVEVFVNGIPTKSVSMTASVGHRIEITIPDGTKGNLEPGGLLHLEFRFKNAARPKDLGINDDARRLAFEITSLTLR